MTIPTIHGLILAVCVAVFPIAAQATGGTGKPVTDSIIWNTTLGDALKVASDSSRYTVANFYTDWCKWCKIQDESTFTDSRVIAMTRRFVFARINAEVDTLNARKYGVNGYPTVIIFDKSGVEVDRLIGYLRPEEFVRTVDEYLEGIGTKAAIEAESREKTQDWKLRYALGEKHIGRGEFEQARSQFLQIMTSDPKNGSGVADKAMFDLAVLNRKEKNWYKAIEGFRKFIKEFPKSKLREDAETYIPWLYSKAGDTKQALKYYQAFLKSFSGSSQSDWVKEQIKLLENPPDSSSS